jgi:hypothetical protein
MIVVDSREQHTGDIKDLLATEILTDIEFQFRCLPKGDYAITNELSMILERKAWGDFMGSYATLKSRLAAMRFMDYDYTALLLEGPYVVCDGRIGTWEGSNLQFRMQHSTAINFLTHQAAQGTILYYTNSLKETILTLINVHSYLPKLGLPTPALKCKNWSELFVMLPGVGGKKLQAVKEKYKTPAEALANITSWLPASSKTILEKW